jgi:hypothetical protein
MKKLLILCGSLILTSPALAQDRQIGRSNDQPLIAGHSAPPLIAVQPISHVTINNFSNDVVYVALYYPSGVPTQSSWVYTVGWFTIAPNTFHSFQFHYASEVHLRIVGNHQECTYDGFDQFLWAPTSSALSFMVETPMIAPEVLTLNREGHVHNIPRTGTYPPGWGLHRFFAVGNQPHVTFNVDPSN